MKRQTEKSKTRSATSVSRKGETRGETRVATRVRAPKAIAKGNAAAAGFQFWAGTAGSWQSSLFGPHEPFTGAWQRNMDSGGAGSGASPLAFSAVYSCITGIASDIAKLPPLLKQETPAGIWEDAGNSPFWKVLRTPNHYQTRIQFFEQWMLSKLLCGNAYIGLERDQRGIIIKMYVLDPCKVQPLVANDGTVYYQLGPDNLNEITEPIIVEASEIIHDRMECLWHPLVGISPLYACMATVGLGNSIQSSSRQFFANASQPGGMLTAPGRISDETANRMKVTFEERFSGRNIGRLFVAGDGLEFKPIAMTADAAQLVEQLQWSVSDVARSFHYPEYKLDASKLPPYSGNNIQTIQMQYLSDCLQKHIESIELLLETGLAVPTGTHIVMDTDTLLRMDTQTLYKTISEGIRGQWLAPNEGRARVDLKAVTGGEYPRAQMQYVSLPDLKNLQTNQQLTQQTQQQAVPREYVADLLSAMIAKELERPSA